MIVNDSGLKHNSYYLRRPIVKSREKRAKTSKNRAKRKKIRLDRNWRNQTGPIDRSDQLTRPSEL